MNRFRLPINQRLVQWLLFFAFHITVAQQNDLHPLSIKHANYFDNLRENVFLHLNKTAFYKGEQLWFTAYVFDQKEEKPSIKSSNLHVGIFDNSGKLQGRKMIYIENGVGYGNFAIDSSFAHKDYYIKAETSWMRNFKESKPFIQNFKILDQPAFSYGISNKEESSAFSIYPEGGYLVSNLRNTIAFKVSDSLGRGYQLNNIQLVNDKGEVVKNNISTSKSGLGKISFYLRDGRDYFLRLKKEKEFLITTALPVARKKGLLLSLNQVDDTMIGKLLVNKPELEQWINKPISLAIHRNGQLSIQEIVIESEETVFSLDKYEIPFGVNAITILDSLQEPILSRLFFNDLGIEDRIADDVLVDYQINDSKDSLIIELRKKEPLTAPISLSISVLPKESLAYSPKNSVTTSFLTSTYIDDSHLSSDLNFDNLSRGDLFELDILMILNKQGRFKWNSIGQGIQVPKYPFESGIEITGKILDADPAKEKQIWGSGDRTKTFFFSEIKSDKSIRANTILYEKDSLRITVLDKKGKLRKPKAEISFQKLLEMKAEEQAPFQYIYFSDENDNDWNSDFLNSEKGKGLTKEATKLDEVVLTASRIPKADIPINDADVSGKRITDEDIKRRGTLQNYLIKLGYRISINGGSVTVLSRTPTPTSMGQRVPIPVYVGGMISNGSDLLNKPLSQVQAIYYDGFGNKFISIVPRYDFYSSKTNRGFKLFSVKNGFSRPEEYYDPGYYNYQTGAFKYFGVIDWLPKVILDYEPKTIKIPILDQQKVQLKIEGMSSSGRLISVSKQLDIDNID
ncbi:hypothetical protein [Spongiivirga citrea]|uniref:Plug domain-containing protein n=1 Tax=Spongiivirga citrea TaxID=1481457 RepID=A0A6M0CH68_9FLAO|nr:hypothetical protein [Spongiivirga citrea]NER17278.1 hypothetical protein [Spongiivirga citrea]